MASVSQSHTKMAEAGNKAPKAGFSEEAIKRDILLMSVELWELMKDTVKGHNVFATMDHWSSRDSRSWEGRSYQWIRGDFTLHAVDASCEQMHGLQRMGLPAGG